MSMNPLNGAMSRIQNFSSSADLTAQKNKELDNALEEFESLFASSLLRTARESNGESWLGGESSAGGDGIMDFAEQHISKAMARQGAFGIAKTLRNTLKSNP